MSLLDDILNEIKVGNTPTPKRKYEYTRPTLERPSVEPPQKRRKEDLPPQEPQKAQTPREQPKPTSKLVTKKPEKLVPDGDELMREMCIMFGQDLPVSTVPGNVVSTVAECKRVLAFLKHQKYTILGIDCEWTFDKEKNAPRAYDLCLVQVGTPDKHFFLFDVVAAGKEALFQQGGLKTLLEDPSILKIFHDCRWDSDILWQQGKTKLCNVFDTQLGYAMFSRQQGIGIPIPVSLNRVLDRFGLGGINHAKKEARDAMEADPNFWKQRPMTELMIEYAGADVTHLPTAYRQIDAILTRSSRQIVDVLSEDYLTQHRERTIEELELAQQEIEKERQERLKQKKFWIPIYGFKDWDTQVKFSVTAREKR